MGNKRKKPLLTVTITQDIFDMIMDIKDNANESVSLVVEKLLRKGLGVGDFDKNEKANMTWYNFEMIHDTIGRIAERVEMLEHYQGSKEDNEESEFEIFEDTLSDLHGDIRGLRRRVESSEEESRENKLKVQQIAKLNEEIKKIKAELLKVKTKNSK